MYRRAAARPKCSSSATATKWRTNRRSRSSATSSKLTTEMRQSGPNRCWTLAARRSEQLKHVHPLDDAHASLGLRTSFTSEKRANMDPILIYGAATALDKIRQQSTSVTDPSRNAHPRRRGRGGGPPPRPCAGSRTGSSLERGGAPLHDRCRPLDPRRTSGAGRPRTTKRPQAPLAHRSEAGGLVASFLPRDANRPVRWRPTPTADIARLRSVRYRCGSMTRLALLPPSSACWREQRRLRRPQLSASRGPNGPTSRRSVRRRIGAAINFLAERHLVATRERQRDASSRSGVRH